MRGTHELETTQRVTCEGKTGERKGGERVFWEAVAWATHRSRASVRSGPASRANLTVRVRTGSGRVHQVWAHPRTRNRTLGPVHQGSGPDQSSKPNCGIPNHKANRAYWSVRSPISHLRRASISLPLATLGSTSRKKRRKKTLESEQEI